MLKVLQACVRHQVWRSVHPATRCVASVVAGDSVGSEAPPRGLDGPTRPRLTSAGDRSCTVDPNLEEQFVFLDLDGTDPQQDSHQGEEQLLHQLSASLAPLPSGTESGSRSGLDGQISPQKQLRSLKLQLQMLKGGPQLDMRSDSQIQVLDVDFPVDESLLASKKKKKKMDKKNEHKIFGTPDLSEPVSDTCCSGCGAMLHCTATDFPGYLPSEKFKVLQREGQLGRATCQRCYLLTHHHKALNVQLSRDKYQEVVQQIRPRKALVLLIVDLLDMPDSIVPNLPNLVGTNKHIVVLGNKVDLLPRDSPNYLNRLKRQLREYCGEAGFGPQVTDVHLISAKTGYGIEDLISSLQRSWKYKGDVYLVGTANSGKSTLFNTLLESDYCKSRASDVIQKATISPWPGTTLNLLKFPIINPTPYRMFRRKERLKETSQQTEEEMSQEERKRLQNLSRHGYLVGRVGRTFRPDKPKKDEIEFDPDSLAFGEDEIDGAVKTPDVSKPHEELSWNELKDAHWLFDTPGILKDLDVLQLLQEQEIRLVVPTQAIIPRTFVLKPQMSLFVGALARIDYLQGEKSCWLSVMASSRVPIHITSLEKADSVYQKHAGHTMLGVPVGGSERMEEFGALVPQEIQLEGRSYLEAAADITLSSAGWVAVTAVEGDRLQMRLHSPPAAGYGVRILPLLPHVVSLKGERVRKSAAYKPLKAAARLDGNLAAGGTTTLQLLNKKRKKAT